LSAHLGREVLSMSAVTGSGLDKLLNAITRELELQRTPEATA
jgi:Fe2+ transport system protein B